MFFRKMKDKARREGFHKGYRTGGKDALVIAVTLAREQGGSLSSEYLRQWLLRLDNEER